MYYVNPNLYKHLKDISPICEQCQGKHFLPDAKKTDQEAVIKEYGILPNDCVPMTTGHPCPYKHLAKK